jgi:DNA-binding transcriptional ArsR family regulator
MMDFDKIKLVSGYIAKDYSKDLLRLLYLYKDISASEAASRLGLHIRTVQEFFDAIVEGGLLSKTEVFESKRPYFRYSLKDEKFSFEIDLKNLAEDNKESGETDIWLREKKNASARFTTARNKLYFSSVAIWIGEGREGSEKKINLTNAQGKFLFHLPFPDADFMSMQDIMAKAGVTEENKNEVRDIVNLLQEHKVIELKVN